MKVQSTLNPSMELETSQSFTVGEKKKIQKVPKRRLLKPNNLILIPSFSREESSVSPNAQISPLSNHYFVIFSPKSPSKLKSFVVIEDKVALTEKLTKLSELIRSSTPVKDLFLNTFGEIAAQDRSLLFSKLLKIFKDRKDHAKIAFIFDCLKTKYQELNDYFEFSKEGRAFKPQSLQLLVDYLQTKKIMEPNFQCIVCKDCEDFESELQKVEKAPLNSTFGFIVRCQNSDSKPTAHMTAIYLQRTNQGWKALQLDAAGHASATLPALALKSNLKVRFFQGGEKRQSNYISCAVYALYDLAKLSFEEHVFDNLEKNLNQENHDDNCIQLSAADLTLDLIKVTEHVGRMKSTVRSKLSSSLAPEKELTVFFDSIKKYLIIEDNRQVNDLVRRLHFKYERYIAEKVLEKTL